jgi:hypothetical protein
MRQNLSNKEDYWIGIVNSREKRTLIHDLSRTTVKMIIAYRFGAINESCVVIELILPLFYSAILVYVTLTNHVCRLIDHLFLVIPSNCSRNSLILFVLRDRTNNKSNNQRILRMLNKSYSQEFEIFRKLKTENGETADTHDPKSGDQARGQPEQLQDYFGLQWAATQ